jgi:hypothetical protein
MPMMLRIAQSLTTIYCRGQNFSLETQNITFEVENHSSTILWREYPRSTLWNAVDRNVSSPAYSPAEYRG